MTSPVQLAAREHPDRLAFDDSVVRITYGQLLGRIENSPVMKLGGLEQGDHVAWCPRNNWDSFLTFWSLHQIGCVACPISYRYPRAEREKMVDRLGAKWLPDLVEGQSVRQKSATVLMERPATILLSSGSTGIPKAVAHPMAAHVASARGAALNMPVKPGDRWLWSLPLFHVSGLSILIRCAEAGATVVGFPEGQTFDSDALARFGVTHLSVVTTQLRRLLDENAFPYESLKAVLLGGSSFDETMIASARKRGVPVHTTYGLTEMASQVTTSSTIDSPSCSGRVLAGRELQISDSGEVLVRGATLCAGYYQDGQIHSVVDEQGWFQTRDLGELAADGSLVVTGRVDNMFVSGGENIYPERIERAMMSAFGGDGVEQVVVVPRQDEAYGDRPVAFVCGQLPRGWEVTLRERLKSYEIPVDVLAWPAEAEGAIKPDRKLLRRKVNATL